MIFSSWSTIKPLYVNVVQMCDSEISVILPNLFCLLKGIMNHSINWIYTFYVEKENIIAFLGKNSNSPH